MNYQWNNIDLSPKTLAMTFNDEVDAIMVPITNQFCCCDDEINKFTDPIKLPNISNYQWTLFEDQTNVCDNTTYHFVSYKSGDTILMSINAKYTDLPDDAQMIVLITKDYFIITGVVGSHPFVETPYISYCNSDGSGPNILERRNDNVSEHSKYIANNFLYYYHRFINDDFH